MDLSKAKKVTKTEGDLARQQDTKERFTQTFYQEELLDFS